MAADPLLLTTAIETVVRAGEIQLAHFGRAMRIDKKGTIDLVTDVDIAVERMFRDLVADRFPDHQVLGEELGGSAAAPPGPCWVFDPVDGTVNYAHGLPIFCASLAFEIDGVAEVAAIYDPNRRELFTAVRGGVPPRTRITNQGSSFCSAGDGKIRQGLQTISIPTARKSSPASVLAIAMFRSDACP